MPVKELSSKQIRLRMEKLSKQINELRYRYHVLDDPSVTDEIYDSLTKELVQFEKDYPQYKLKNSPTERVGGVALEKFVKVTHRQRMLSLNDAFSFEEVKDWEDRLKKILPDASWNYF